MASSMGTISRRLYRSMFLTPAISCSHITKLLFCTEPSHHAYSSDADELSPDSVSETVSTSATSPDSSSLSSSGSTRQRIVADRPLEGGMDIGIYKAILVGQVGQNPLQKMLRNGRAVTLTSVGTGGMRNERIPFDNEEPREYADRCMVQWHRVVVYNERLGRIVMKHAQAGLNYLGHPQCLLDLGGLEGLLTNCCYLGFPSFSKLSSGPAHRSAYPSLSYQSSDSDLGFIT